MDYSNIILACYNNLAKAYLEIGKLNQLINFDHNSIRMINIHGYCTVRNLISKLTGENIEMCKSVKDTYQAWTQFKGNGINIYDKYNLYPEKANIIDPLIRWKHNQIAKKYGDIDNNGSLIDILNSLTDYSDSLIKGAIFYAKIISELPLEDVSYVFGEVHLSYILSSIISMPFFPIQTCKKEEFLQAIDEFKNGNVEFWVNYFLTLIITQCQNNYILLSDIENYIQDLKAKMISAGVSHLKINQFCDILMDNTFVDAKIVASKTGLVHYRAKLALDLMAENGILLRSNTKRNTTYILIDYYRKFLNS